MNIRLRFAAGAMFGSIACLTTGGTLAQEEVFEDPGVRTVYETQTEFAEYRDDATVQERWEDFVKRRGWDQHRVLGIGGLFHIEDEQMIISQATATTRVRVGQPGWIESRVFAYERAEMDAKGKIVKFISQQTGADRSFNLSTDNAWNDGARVDYETLSEGQELGERLRGKSARALERSIDAINRKLDPEYDQDAYTTPEKKVEVWRHPPGRARDTARSGLGFGSVVASVFPASGCSG